MNSNKILLAHTLAWLDYWAPRLCCHLRPNRFQTGFKPVFPVCFGGKTGFSRLCVLTVRGRWRSLWRIQRTRRVSFVLPVKDEVVLHKDNKDKDVTQRLCIPMNRRKKKQILNLKMTGIKLSHNFFKSYKIIFVQAASFRHHKLKNEYTYFLKQ